MLLGYTKAIRYVSSLRYLSSTVRLRSRVQWSPARYRSYGNYNGHDKMTQLTDSYDVLGQFNLGSWAICCGLVNAMMRHARVEHACIEL